MFDDKCRYISANDYLKKLYPEINHLKVDCEVPEEDNAFYNEVIQFLYQCYKEAFTYDEAFKIIEESLGQHFDPKLGKIFMSCRPELEDLYNIFLEK